MTNPSQVLAPRKTLLDYNKLQEEFEALKQRQVAAAASSQPATIRIANEIQSALSNGDLQRANLLHQIHKSFDRGILPYGEGSLDQQVPEAPMTQGSNAPPPLPPVFGSDPVVAESEAAIRNTQARFGTNPYQRPDLMPTSMPGYGQAVGAIEATKSGMSKQAEKDVELNMNPQIGAATKKAESRATYTEDGFQSLPKMARALEAKELKSEYLEPKINNIIARANGFTTGFGGALTNAIPGSPAFDLRADLQTLLANSGFDRLQEMRDNSPTGGALGAVSEIELQLLQSASEQLMASQSAEQLKTNLVAFQAQRNRSLENIRRAYEEDYKRFGGQADIYLPAPGKATEPAAKAPIDTSGWKFLGVE